MNSHGSLSTSKSEPPPGERILDVWSGREYQLTEGQDNSLEIETDTIRLAAESHIADSAVLALRAAFTLPESAFRKYLVISPQPSKRPDGASRKRTGRVGIRVIADMPASEVKRVRDFYEVELQGKWDNVVERIQTAAMQDTIQSELQFNEAASTPREVSTERTFLRGDADTPLEAGRAEAARQTVANEIAARLMGKAFNFSLAPQVGEPVICQGQFEAPQKEWKEDSKEHSPLYGSIVSMSKQPPELKLKASTDINASHLGTYVVSYIFTDEKIKELSEYFGLPAKIQLEFKVKRQQARSIRGDEHRYDLIACSVIPSSTPRANRKTQATTSLLIDSGASSGESAEQHTRNVRH